MCHLQYPRVSSTQTLIGIVKLRGSSERQIVLTYYVTRLKPGIVNKIVYNYGWIPNPSLCPLGVSKRSLCMVLILGFCSNHRWLKILLSMVIGVVYPSKLTSAYSWSLSVPSISTKPAVVSPHKLGRTLSRNRALISADLPLLVLHQITCNDNKF